jgi:hypothetical protein
MIFPYAWIGVSERQSWIKGWIRVNADESISQPTHDLFLYDSQFPKKARNERKKET